MPQKPNFLKSLFSTHVLFLVLFFCLAVYLRWEVMNAPLDENYHVSLFRPYLGLSVKDILLFPYSRYTTTYRYAFTNTLFDHYGISEVNHRLFSAVISLLTLVFIYRFAAKELGRREALISTFFFGISYYSLWTIWNPNYGEVVMFASFLSFYYLWKGFQELKVWHWVALGIINFLNLTNCLIAGNFLVPFLSVALVLIFLQIKTDHAFTQETKRKTLYFAIAFSVSMVAVVVMYYARGYNMPLQVYKLLFLHSTEGLDNIYKTSDYIQTEVSFTSLLTFMLYISFVTFNFEYGDGHGQIGGIPLGHWSYCALFVVGLLALLKRDRKLYSCFYAVLFVPILVSVFILKMAVSRYIAFIQPFYLMTIAVGFIYLFNWINKFVQSDAWKNTVVCSSAFIFFSLLVQPGFLFNPTVIDEQFYTEGIRGAAKYLYKNIKPNDIILNVTRDTELRTGYGDALALFTYAPYLGRFEAEHRLELLPWRKGRVGIWLVLEKPLDNDKLLPFYFPGTYAPKLVKKSQRMFLYYGEIDIPESEDIEKDKLFTTPFWSFTKAYEAHLAGHEALAEKYYRKFLDYGYNPDRAYFNLGIMYFPVDVEKSLQYFNKAVEILETSTVVPAGLKVEGWSAALPDKNGILDYSIRSYETRYFMIEKEGVKTKVWFREDLTKANPIYTVYYLVLGKKYLNLYKKTGDQQYFDKALSCFEKGPGVMLQTIAKQLRENKNDALARTEAIADNTLLNLVGIYELFPPLAKAEWQ